MGSTRFLHCSYGPLTGLQGLMGVCEEFSRFGVGSCWGYELYGLHSLKGSYIGDSIGEYFRAD